MSQGLNQARFDGELPGAVVSYDPLQLAL